jgi:hypothetical protein
LRKIEWVLPENPYFFFEGPTLEKQKLLEKETPTSWRFRGKFPCHRPWRAFPESVGTRPGAKGSRYDRISGAGNVWPFPALKLNKLLF